MQGAIQDVIKPANFGEDRLRGFGVATGEGSNFGLFHWLASSPLKHSRTTVRVCDNVRRPVKLTNYIRYHSLSHSPDDHSVSVHLILLLGPARCSITVAMEMCNTEVAGRHAHAARRVATSSDCACVWPNCSCADSPADNSRPCWRVMATSVNKK